MVSATFNFPKGFLWGTATASHQVEGNNKNNDWWAWEQEAGRIVDGHSSGLACDWWGGRWKEDFDRAAEGGQNAMRISIEWSRVQPAPDRWDEHALDHYRQMVRGLTERGLMPMVTLHHFTNPLWLEELGGWEDDQTPERFAVYVSKVVEALKEYVTMWCTINEPNVYAYSSYLTGEFPPGKRNLGATFKVMVNMVYAHARAFAAIRKIQPVSRVGTAIHYRDLVPWSSWSPLDRWAAGLQAGIFNDLFPSALRDGVIRLPFSRIKVPEAKGTQDYLGINYYTQERVQFNPLVFKELFGQRSFPPDTEFSDHEFLVNRPEGMMNALKWGLQYAVPMIITENGVPDAEDHLRPRYLVEHIREIWKGVNFNWPVKGYFHWTLVDNFEWALGWTHRFGLWQLDTNMQSRTKRPSAELYEAICNSNSLSAEMVGVFAPSVLDQMFPGPE